MLYLNLCSRLTVIPKGGGQVVLDRISRVEINKTVETLGDKATIVIPRRYGDGTDDLKFYIAAGDRATLELGYNGELNVEFRGYIREIESGFPMKLHLDDETYPMRTNSLMKSWKNVTLREVLEFIAPGYEIDCHGATLGKFQIDNQSTLSVLRTLRERYGFYTVVKEDRLTCKFKYDIVDDKRVHVYDFSKNVKKHSLKYRRREDRNIRIRAVSYNADGRKITEEVGSKEQHAPLRTLSYTGKTAGELRELALAEYGRLCFDGFEGSITGFGLPQTNAGDSLRIISAREPKMEGKYLIESVTVRYGNAYYERINQLSYRIE